MQNQFALWLAAMFGLTQCTEELETQDTDPAPTIELAGTWMEVRTTFDTTNDERVWSGTERKTIIVEKVGDGFRFRDCVEDTEVAATVDEEDVTLSSGDYPVLRLSEPDTLTAVENTGDTEVALYRLTTNTQAVVAQLDLSQPQAMNTWSQLCLGTVVAPAAENSLRFKAVNTVPLLSGDVVVGMTFGFPQPVAPGTYDYPDPQSLLTVTGVFSLPGETEAGILSEPDGTLEVSGSDPWTFDADLSMTNSLDAENPLTITGVLSVDPQWFEAELQ
jgi:hypothetical protein